MHFVHFIYKLNSAAEGTYKSSKALKAIIILMCAAILNTSCGKEDPATKSEDWESRYNERQAFLKELDASYETLEIEKQLSPYEVTLVNAGLVNVRDMDSNILVDLKYASSDNFLDSAVYGDLKNCFLRIEAAAMLSIAQDILNSRKPGYRLLVFDGVRPTRVQKKMWELVRDTDKRHYVANPDGGSLHNYGCAVDLSIADASGQALDMGTEFDHFGPLAQPRHNEEHLRKKLLTTEQIENTELLASVMQEAGFQPIASEWWHFNAFGLNHAREHFVKIE